MSVIARKQAE